MLGVMQTVFFPKAGPIPVTEPCCKHSVVHITLQRPAADDPKAREEFYKGHSRTLNDPDRTAVNP
jgi:hypothetical protein